MAIDLTGERFKRLVVLRRASKEAWRASRAARWDCRCDCGKLVTVSGQDLRDGLTRSCGCFQKDRAVEVHTQHGMTGIPEHKIWSGMWQRCENPDHRLYKYYGGRGIRVCERWRDFTAFYADMGERPSPEHSIDRRDNAKGYEPGNCYWATKLEQQNNTRFNRFLAYKGVTKSVSAWAREIGMTPSGLAGRLDKQGMSIEEALTLPRRRRAA